MNQNLKSSVVVLPLLLFALVISTASSSCSTMPFRERADSLFLITEHVKVYYELKQPAEKHFLPYVLSEISGLAFLGKNRVLCVEDEGGRVYEYDLKERRIINAITFDRPGDYEGVELLDSIIYVLRSDGDLYRFEYTEEDIAESTKKFETDLGQKNDTEGLGYNAVNNSLLIACKEDGDIKGVNTKGKVVYEFDIKKEKLKKEPLFQIRMKDLENFFEANRDFEYEEERIKFEPSAIALNPIDGLYYILASSGKLMVVLNSKGSIKATYPIAPRVLSQPEGLCFAPNGDMYISSEGEGDKGYILKFPIKRK